MIDFSSSRHIGQYIFARFYLSASADEIRKHDFYLKVLIIKLFRNIRFSAEIVMLYYLYSTRSH